MDVFKNGSLGNKTPVMDARKKVTGQLSYVDDIKIPGMLYGKVLFSPYAHAEITSIDALEAEKMEGVWAVVWHKDSPSIRYNANGEDSSILPSERVFDTIVRYVGDKVAAVAAETPEIAEEAIKKIRVTYRQLPVCLDPKEAALPGAYPIHETGNSMEEVKLSAGNLEAGFLEADMIFEDSYEVPAIYHAAMEPHVSLSTYEVDGKLTVYTPSQDVFGQRMNLAKIFGMPMSRVRVLSPAMGGGFGGKIDLITEPISALLAMKTGKAVKVAYQRKEDIQSSTTRHAESISIKTGIKKNGEITACDYKVYLSAGAHSGATMSVAWAAGGKFFKLLKIPNLQYHAIPVYTNRAVAGAMRGFGSPQLFYAINSQLNQIATTLKMDICKLQMLNLYDPNKLDQRGEALGNLRVKECVKRGMELFGWEHAIQEQIASKKEEKRIRIGVGMATAPHGSSLFGVMPDTCGVMIKMNEDGSITMFTGVSDMGNGSNTTQAMLISEVLGIPLGHIACVKTDTETTLFDVGAYASRGTYVGGGAAVKAAKSMRRKILREASQMIKVPGKSLELKENRVYLSGNHSIYVTMQEIAEHAHQKERDIVVSEIFGTKASPISAGAHFVKIQIDMETGEVSVIDYVAVHDVGKPLNSMGLEGQVHGGIQMGLGYALSEGVILDESGMVQGKRLRDCHLFTATMMPKIQVEFLDSYEKSGPYGAKSVGECATVPSAAAIANAIANALDFEFKKLPIRKEEIQCHIMQL
ncbi:MAG: xanthine dehydrogenase family protein molybdopterin-binding subunit [Velocimicrobium sp.]